MNFGIVTSHGFFGFENNLQRKEMSHKNLLFRLPNAWLVHFLSVWLDIVDVGRLDSAMTNEQYRQFFCNVSRK